MSYKNLRICVSLKNLRAIFILFRQCSSVFVLSRQCPFQMLYLCIVFERPKLRVRVLTIFPTCTSKISYVYPHPGPLRHKSSLTLLTGRPIVLNLSHTDLTDPTDFWIPKTSKTAKSTKTLS